MTCGAASFRQVGEQLSDPFGADFVDLPVMSFVTHTLESTRRIVGRPSKQHLHPHIENELASVAFEHMALDKKKQECYEENCAGFPTCTSAVFPPRGGGASPASKAAE